MTRSLHRPLLILAVCLLQLGLVTAAVHPRLSARTTGDELRLAVAPVDPIDPFRGAYVVLTYPGLPLDVPDVEGAAFVPLVPHGEVWRGTAVVAERPATGPYLACASNAYELRCGIESLFASQERARTLEALLQDGDAVAILRVDGRGNAAVVTIEAR